MDRNYTNKIKKIFKKLIDLSESYFKKVYRDEILLLFLQENERKLVKRFLKGKNKAEKFERVLVKKLKNEDFVIFGAGGGGKLFFNWFCKKYDLFPLYILDRYNIDNTYFKPISVKFFPDACKGLNKNQKIIIAVNKKVFQEEIVKDLKKEGFKNIILLPLEFWGSLIYRNYLELEICWQNYIQSIEFYLKNKEKIIKVLEFLSDERSKEIYYKSIRNLLLLKNEKVSYEPLEKQYFPEDIKFNKGYGIFIDCGAYVGDTIQQLNKYYGKINTLICFEPNIENYNELQGYLQKNLDNIADTILALPCAVYNKERFFRFKKAGAGSSIVNSEKEGGETVFSVILDKVLCNFKPTFIKMDIEGSELLALKGARRIIKKHKPDLAICVYHHPAHFWEIPLYLKKIVPEYKLYLRKYGERFIIETVLYATV